MPHRKTDGTSHQPTRTPPPLMPTLTHHTFPTDAITRRAQRIPRAMREDPTIVGLVALRRNLLHRFRYISQRASSFRHNRSVTDKRHTQERRAILKRLRPIERDLIRALAQETRHPEIWTPPHAPPDVDPFDHRAFSVRDAKIRSWVMTKRIPGYSHPQRSAIAQTHTKLRHRLALEIQDLDYTWLSALTYRIEPTLALPPRCTIHPRRYRP